MGVSGHWSCPKEVKRSCNYRLSGWISVQPQEWVVPVEAAVGGRRILDKVIRYGWLATLEFLLVHWEPLLPYQFALANHRMSWFKARGHYRLEGLSDVIQALSHIMT